jgi:hypothetical protein
MMPAGPDQSEAQIAAGLAAAGGQPAAADVPAMLRRLQELGGQDREHASAAVSAALGETGGGATQPGAAADDPAEGGGLHLQVAGEQPRWLRGIVLEIENRLRALEGRPPVQE